MPSRIPPRALVLLVLGSLAASRFLALADSPGEIDEAVFAGAVLHFDLFSLSPQAPGFPVWILIGRLFSLFVPSPFTALAMASTLLSAVALPALYVWGRRIVGGWAALAGTALAAALPVVWVNGGRAFSDTPSTAFFLVALALLALAEEPAERHFAGGRMPEGRRERVLAVAAGLSAAAGAGVRPHLVLAFALALALSCLRLVRRGRLDAAAAFTAAGLAGCLAWGAWLWAQAGGTPGLFASLSERAGFRAHAFATGTFGTLTDSFLVRDFVSPRRAAAVIALALLGLVASARRQRRLDLVAVLVPTFLSLWFLHSRAMSRYSVPFAMALALAAAAGIEVLLRRPAIAFLATSVLAAVFARESLPEARRNRLETPPMAALRTLERYVHPGRETIVADEDFQPFLRLERWDGRLVAWGYLDSEFVSGARQINRRLVRLSDATEEPEAYRDGGWRIFWRAGHVAEALGNRRLLTVALRDPAPPVFGPGFGVKERSPGRAPFRWSGTSARLLVGGLQGPPVALLHGVRPTDAGATLLTVTDAHGRRVTSHTVLGTFDLAIVVPVVFGPLPGPAAYTISCDRPVTLPPIEGAARPTSACAVFDDITGSRPAEEVWETIGARNLLDIGSPRDAWADPAGFHQREREEPLSVDLRWTSAESSVVWVPRAGLVPRVVALRARAPFAAPVDVRVFVGDVPAGTLRVPPGDFSEVRLALTPEAADALAGPDPVRLVLRSATVVPREVGKGSDTRAIGVAVDRILVE